KKPISGSLRVLALRLYFLFALIILSNNRLVLHTKQLASERKNRLHACIDLLCQHAESNEIQAHLTLSHLLGGLIIHTHPSHAFTGNECLTRLVFFRPTR